MIDPVFGQYPGVEAIGAGTNSDAETPVSGDLIEWAEAVLVMEASHRNKIAKKFKSQLKGKKLAVLDIPDNFECMQPELISLLKAKVPRCRVPEDSVHFAEKVEGVIVPTVSSPVSAPGV